MYESKILDDSARVKVIAASYAGCVMFSDFWLAAQALDKRGEMSPIPLIWDVAASALHTRTRSSSFPIDHLGNWQANVNSSVFPSADHDRAHRIKLQPLGWRLQSWAWSIDVGSSGCIAEQCLFYLCKVESTGLFLKDWPLLLSVPR